MPCAHSFQAGVTVPLCALEIPREGIMPAVLPRHQLNVESTMPYLKQNNIALDSFFCSNSFLFFLAVESKLKVLGCGAFP